MLLLPSDRLVDCSSLRRALEGFYSVLLAKGSYPFVYLSLEIQPHKIDVNVHPTKREVGFEDEDEVVELLCQALASKLEQASESRSFTVQTLLPGARPPDEPASKTRKSSRAGVVALSEDEEEEGETQQADGASVLRANEGTRRKVAPKSMVRTDHATRTLDSMFMPVSRADSDRPAKRQKFDSTGPAENDEDDSEDTGDPSRTAVNVPTQQPMLRVTLPQSDTALTSVRELRREVLAARDKGSPGALELVLIRC